MPSSRKRGGNYLANLARVVGSLEDFGTVLDHFRIREVALGNTCQKQSLRALTLDLWRHYP